MIALLAIRLQTVQGKSKSLEFMRKLDNCAIYGKPHLLLSYVEYHCAVVLIWCKGYTVPPIRFNIGHSIWHLFKIYYVGT